jgi:hypothetical protein
MKTKFRNFAVALATLWMVGTANAQQPDFATPEEAAGALAEAVRAADPQALLSLMGPESDAWLFTDDDVADRADWARFLEAWDQHHVVQPSDNGTATLLVGEDNWAFPAPIVKREQRWVFDGAAGRDEVTKRRVGRNEIDTIQTLLAIVDAQREYAANDADGDGYLDYARRFISTPGSKDGLYWPVEAGEQQSPLGPLVGAATQAGYQAASTGEPQPYHGYYYRLLTAQGPDAAGGAYDYLVGDRLLAGFAVVAHPARYGVSGIMTLMVSHDGQVYEKDLGEATGDTVAAMSAYNPDASWTKSAPQ